MHRWNADARAFVLIRFISLAFFHQFFGWRLEKHFIIALCTHSGIPYVTEINMMHVWVLRAVRLIPLLHCPGSTIFKTKIRNSNSKTPIGEVNDVNDVRHVKALALLSIAYCIIPFCSKSFLGSNFQFPMCVLVCACRTWSVCSAWI